MLRYSYLIIFIGILSACTAPQEKKNEALPAYDTLSYNYLSSLNLSGEVESIKFHLDTANIHFRDVYDFAIHQHEVEKYTPLLQAVCLNNENYLQEENPSYWAGILYDLPKFISEVNLLKTPQQTSFMDIGSGNGDKLYAALCMGFEKAYGLEYAQELVTISKKSFHEFIQNKQIEITLGDALKVPLAYYAQVDFLYMYSPIKDPQTMAVLFKRVMEGMKEGATLLEVRMVYSDELRQLTQLNIPKSMGLFAITKKNGEYYYIEYDIKGNQQLKQLLPIK